MFHLVRGSVYLLAVLGASLSFFFLYTGLVTMFTYFVFIVDIYIYIYDDDDDVYLLHLSLYMLFLFSLYSLVSYYCIQSFISISH